MAATSQILIYSIPELPQLIDPSVLITAGYDVVTFTEPQAVETWLTTFLADDLLIIINPSANEALRFASEILSTHPCLPIIIVTNQPTSSNLKQALEIGIFDYLTYPVESPALLISVKHSLIRQNNWQKRESLYPRFG